MGIKVSRFKLSLPRWRVPVLTPRGRQTVDRVRRSGFLGVPRICMSLCTPPSLSSLDTHCFGDGAGHQLCGSRWPRSEGLSSEACNLK
ncbi:hypothetical protein EVAR_46509_1 [Eumeta japonica]|uniref:Uncharacterized protein n=1 Tax=Eumeta variegata TaxID=151549 RepID=A0A4C1WT43_EUMVA|nr:hypothetical protein EVAR_46509_1 [Eumeta japonica]